MTETGSIALAEVLPNLQELRTVNLGDCLVRNDGATAIAEAIKGGHKLLQVSLFVCFEYLYSLCSRVGSIRTGTSVLDIGVY